MLHFERAAVPTGRDRHSSSRRRRCRLTFTKKGRAPIVAMMNAPIVREQVEACPSPCPGRGTLYVRPGLALEAEEVHREERQV